MTSGGFLSSVGKSFSKLIGKDSPSGKSRIPYLIVWNFTNSCNLKCKHCYQDAQLEPTADELTLDEKLRFVDTIANAGVKVPMLSGGEPLLHPDFFPILEKLASRKMHASAASNATMITPDFATRARSKEKTNHLFPVTLTAFDSCQECKQDHAIVLVFVHQLTDASPLRSL